MDKYNNNPILHEEQEQKLAAETAQEAEESLSLINLPVNSNEEFINTQNHQQSTEQNEIFEFYSDLNSKMSHAEDIFFCGKLKPLEEKPLSDDNQMHNLSCNDEKLKGFDHRRRCESLSESSKTRVMRNSRSLDCRKMNRNSSLSHETPSVIRRVLSDKSSEKSGDVSGMRSILSKPRWYLLMFGIVKFPQEMDLHDIKTRQIRRKPGKTSMFPGNLQNDDRKNSWDLLKMLSCKSHASVAVTASINGQQCP